MLYLRIISALFISLPEELLVVAITLIASGYKEALNFRSRSNIIKLLLSASLMVVFSLTVNSFCDLTYRFIINTLLFYTILVLTYRKKPIAFFLGFLLSLTILLTSDSLFYPLFIKISGLPYTEIYNTPYYNFMASLPARIIQICSFLILCKIRKADLRLIKLFTRDYIIIIVYFFILAGNVFLISERIKTNRQSIATIIGSASSFIIISVIFFILIKHALDLRQKIFLKETQYDIELSHLKELIKENKTEHAVDLIDKTLNERGYFDK